MNFIDVDEFNNDLSKALTVYSYVFERTGSVSESTDEAYNHIRNCNNRIKLLKTLLLLEIDYRNIPRGRSIGFWSELDV